jgi:alpha-tubulin suppressor-like RCC1 family protein
VVVGLLAVAGCGRIDFDPLTSTVSQARGTLAMGDGFACELHGPDVWCWGEGDGGQTGTDTNPKFVPTQVPGLPAMQQVTTGSIHTCALSTDGDVWCWGFNSLLQLGNTRAGNNANFLPPVPFEHPDPQPVTTLPGPAIAIAGGGNHTCALLADLTVWCWGDNSNGQLGRGTSDTVGDLPAVVPGLTGVVALTLGDADSCALHGDGRVSCWGADDYSQIGDAGTADVLTPFTIPGLAATQISAGGNHVCALVHGGAFACWGSNDFGELGDGTQVAKTVAVPSAIGGFLEIDAGRDHSCAIDSASRVTCWGRNDIYMLGDGTTQDRALPLDAIADIGGNAVAVVAAVNATCAVRDDAATLCWGYGSRGQIGDGHGAMPTPQHVELGGTVAAHIEVGDRHTCIASGDTLKCWGDNSEGQLGIGSVGDPQMTPTNAIQTWGTATISDVGVGDLHTCAVAGGALYCWGSNTHGQVGNGMDQPQPTPVLIDVGGQTVNQIAVMGPATCASTTNQSVYCWGWNNNGTLGDGTMMSSNTPILVPGLSAVDELVAGTGHVCARSGTSVACWGNGNAGQLGNGSTSDQNTATPIPGLSATALSAGGGTTCALDSGGMTECWGNNWYSLIDQALPSLVVSPSIVARPLLSIGQSVACDPADGCWGDNWFGEIGAGSFDATTTGLAGGVGTATLLSIANRHVCGVFPGGTYCWGDNDFGQLGIGVRTIATRPALVTFP